MKMLNSIKTIVAWTGGVLFAFLVVFLKGISLGKEKVKNNINKARVKDYERMEKIRRDNAKLDRNDLLKWLSKFQSK